MLKKSQYKVTESQWCPRFTSDIVVPFQSSRVDDSVCSLSLGNLGSGLCFRGEVVSKAGPEEAIIYADIGEWKRSLYSGGGVMTVSTFYKGLGETVLEAG